MNIFRQIFGSSEKADLTAIIKEGALLADVRTAAEFAEGHVKGSVNIPLDQVPAKLSQFRNQKNIIVFCRSGSRSSQAKAILEQNGFTNVINGGTWQDVKEFLK